MRIGRGFPKGSNSDSTYPLDWRPAWMGRPLSGDLRSRVVEAVKAGLSGREASERFGVSAASAVRWVAAWRRTGRFAAKPQGGDRRSSRIEAFGPDILAALKAKVDMTLDELAAMLRERYGARFARSTIWRFLDRHAMTVKKNGARSRAGQARRRSAARRGSPPSLISIRKSSSSSTKQGASTKMARSTGAPGAASVAGRPCRTSMEDDDVYRRAAPIRR